jgi:hypothetical protein
MVRTPVQSSNLSSVGYDPVQQILEVQFLQHPSKTPGDIYDYSNVSQMVYDGLMQAPSKGHYLYEVIKRGGYAYTKVFDTKTLQGAPGGSTGLSESLLNPAAIGLAATESIAPATATPVAATDSVIPSLPDLGLPSLGDLL